jgi:hypothetical protein
VCTCRQYFEQHAAARQSGAAFKAAGWWHQQLASPSRPFSLAIALHFESAPTRSPTTFAVAPARLLPT